MTGRGGSAAEAMAEELPHSGGAVEEGAVARLTGSQGRRWATQREQDDAAVLCVRSSAGLGR